MAPAPLPRLAIFARAPLPGRVKTRLAQAVGDDAALCAYRRLLEQTLARLAPGQGGFAPEVWLDGDPVLATAWAGDLRLVGQPQGDLGARMAAAFASGVKVLVGTDIPDLTADYVEQALAALAESDVVLGPVADGGYCLIGMNEPQPQLFADIPWSSGEVLSATRRAARGLRVALLDELWDVDDEADLSRWRATPKSASGSPGRRPPG